MTAKEIIKNIMKDKRVTNAEIAKELHITQYALWDRLNPKRTDNMTVNNLNIMLRSLGFKAVIVPNDKRISDGEYELEAHV